MPTNWSQEAEQSVLGSLLLDNAALGALQGVLAAADFFDSRHGEIYRSIATLFSAGRPADPVTVAEELKGGEVQGALEYLEALASCVPSAANVGAYAEIVAQRALQRRLVDEADRALALAQGDGTPEEKLETIVVGFLALEKAQQRRSPRRLHDILVAVLEQYQAQADGRDDSSLPTGIEPLDRLLAGGLRPGRVYGIAARPSVGKSSAARTIMLNAARAGAPVLLLTLEVPAQDVAEQLIAEEAQIDGIRLENGRLLEDSDWERLPAAAGQLGRLPIHLDDQGGLTLPQIRLKARQVRGLRLLVLDYLQLCRAATGARDRTKNDEVAEISQGLKALALELGIPIVVLSQLNREVERRLDKEPMLADLRDSGAIEQDLDVAILLWTAQEGETSRLVGWTVAKNRKGPKGSFAMRWKPATNSWLESDEPLRGPNRR